jgi:hypothetical protein
MCVCRSQVGYWSEEIGLVFEWSMGLDPGVNPWGSPQEHPEVDHDPAVVGGVRLESFVQLLDRVS